MQGLAVAKEDRVRKRREGDNWCHAEVNMMSLSNSNNQHRTLSADYLYTSAHWAARLPMLSSSSLSSPSFAFVSAVSGFTLPSDGYETATIFQIPSRSSSILERRNDDTPFLPNPCLVSQVSTLRLPRSFLPLSPINPIHKK